MRHAIALDSNVRWVGFAALLISVASSAASCTDVTPEDAPSLTVETSPLAGGRVSNVRQVRYDADRQAVRLVAEFPVGVVTAAARADFVLDARVSYTSLLTGLQMSSSAASLLRDATRIASTGPGKAAVEVSVWLPNLPDLEPGFAVDVHVPGLSNTGPDCPEGCSGHGFCVTGGCVCASGYEGANCATQSACPNACNQRGVCIAGACQCLPGFGGADCSTDANPGCEQTCVHGVCSHGSCFCLPGYAGKDCSEPVGCVNACNNLGVCVSGSCFCSPGYSGPDCSETLACPNDCSGRGACLNGRCFCEPGYSGTDCSEALCPNACSGRGTCLNGRCFCEPGYSGTDCSETLACPNACSGRGACLNGRCFCEPGYSGTDCSETLACPNACSDRGACLNGRCFCNAGYLGADCSLSEN